MSFDDLPWETRPQTVESFKTIEWKGGILKIPQYGYMVTDEMAEIAKVDPKNAVYSLTIKKASELASLLDLSSRYCWAFLTKVLGLELGQSVTLSEQEETLRIDNHGFIQEYLDEIRATQARIMIRSAHTILQRVAPSWPEEKTQKLPVPLLHLIYDFQQEEERGPEEPTDPEEEARQLEEALGKLEEVSQSIATAQTGSTPTGSANDSGPAIPHSPAKDLANSRPTMSTKRSKKAIKPKDNGFIEKNLV